MKETEESFLKSLHPAVSVIYFLFVLCITMFSLHPVILLLSLLMALLAVARMCGGRRLCQLLWIALPMLVFSVVLLPIFNHNGVTPLFYINDMAVTLENVVYGCFMTVMIVAVTAWFFVAGSVIDSEKMLYVFGKLSPKIALVISMVLRFIPMFVQRLREIHEAQIGMLYMQETGIFARAKQFTKEVSILISWCLENSIDTSVSMESRGYGIGKRSSYHRFKMKKSDVLILIGILLLGGITLLAMAGGSLEVYYFPEMSMEVRNGFAVAALCSELLLMTVALAGSEGRNA